MTVALLALGVGAGRARAAVEVTFNVEVPYCTPFDVGAGKQVMLRSDRNTNGTYVHDVLTRADPTHYTGTFTITTALTEFDYKYTLGTCSAGACPGIEKDITFDGSGAEVPDRRLAEGTTTTSDFVYLWRDSRKLPESDGDRGTHEKIAFCGPYLAVNTPDGGLSISYDSYYAQPLTLELGKSTSYELTTLHGAAAPTYRNHFALPALEPATLYHYRITENGVPGPDQTFCSPPSAGEPLRFAFLGDFQYWVEAGVTPQQMLADDHALASHILPFNPHLTLSTGDTVNSQDGLLPQMGRWQVAFGIIAPVAARAPFMAAMGNHEEDVDYFWDVYDRPLTDGTKKDHYSFKLGNTFFMVLYTGVTFGFDTAGILASHAPWMEQQLAAASADANVRWKVVVMHRGAFSQGANHVDGNQFYDGGEPSWHTLWKTHGVDLVLAGHNHNFTLARNEGTHFVTSCGGAGTHPLRTPWEPTTIYAERTCSADLFEATNRTLSLTPVRPDGSVITEGKIVLCHADADCADLDKSCENGTPEWSCREHECVAECVFRGDDGNRDDSSPPAAAKTSAPESGCGCSAAGQAPVALAVILLVLASALRRRTRPRSRAAGRGRRTLATGPVHAAAAATRAG